MTEKRSEGAAAVYPCLLFVVAVDVVVYVAATSAMVMNEIVAVVMAVVVTETVTVTVAVAEWLGAMMVP